MSLLTPVSLTTPTIVSMVKSLVILGLQLSFINHVKMVVQSSFSRRTSLKIRGLIVRLHFRRLSKLLSLIVDYSISLHSILSRPFDPCEAFI